MPISRRGFVASLLAAGLAPAAPALASEPFPVFKSDADQIPRRFRRQEVEYQTKEPAGTLIIDPDERYLYLVLGNGRATRYGVSVGKKGKAWSGVAEVKKMAKWPVWVPTPEQLAEYPSFAKYIHGMPGGRGNPMGARALYLYQGEIDTVYRIHGAVDPKLIGRTATAGCISLINVDVIHLYDQVKIGTRVVVLPHRG